MPKLRNRPPKYSRMGKYAVVYFNGKPNYLGLYGSPESKVAYARIVAEIESNPAIPLSSVGEERQVTVRELAAAFLNYAKTSINPTDYAHYRTIVLDFLDKLYGDNTSVEKFTPRCLKLVRDEMIRSGRFCRNIINKYIKFTVAIFGWGVENELVPETTWRALKAVKSLLKGHEGTFDHEEREAVPDDVVVRTLPFMPPTLKAMIIVQRLTGCRPSEVFNMKVGDIIKNAAPGLWHYVRKNHKTERFIGKKIIPLGKPEQELIAPYLEDKTPESAVFSPRTAMAERSAEKRVARKTPLTPSQIAKDKERAAKPSRYSEFYNECSYRLAIIHAIAKGNKVLPEEQKIPHWYPYQLRHSASTATELAHSDEDAQALLGHRTVNMTKRYTHTQLARREALARNRHNPFDTEES